jgi:beta-glucanase (GH16 family)
MYLKLDGTAIAVSGANNGVNLWASGTGQILQGGDLNDVLGGQSGGTLIGGLGDNQYYLQGYDVTIVQGATGINTVNTWMDYALPDNIQNLNVWGAGLYAVGNSLDNLITVGDDNGMQLYGAAGNNVLVGGLGTDTFIIGASAGTDAIYNWHAGDTIRLTAGSPLATFAQVQAAMTQQGSDVLVHNGVHDFVIRNATVGQFTAADFALALDTSKLGALTFDDEFNSLSLYDGKSGVWTPHYWYGGQGAYTLSGNGELQLYTAPGFTGSGTTDLGLNPFSITNGVLDIHAQTVTATQSAAMWNYKYSSGVITTHDTFAQTYGYFEMRAELPSNDGGAWPAFWMVPADGSWPPELDILEQLSGNANLIYTTQHTLQTGAHTAVGSANYVPDATGFHTYGVLWTPTDLIWYVDGEQVFETATPADMNKPMYIIANMAVGGWSGTPDWTSADMYVDYIRAYSIPGVTQVVSTLPPPAGGSTGGSTGGSSGGSTGGSGGGSTAPPPPAAPTGLADAAVVGGYVNQVHNTAAQALTGKAAAGAVVTAYDGQAAVGSATADANGAWSITLGALTDGAHSLTATAANAAGVSGSSAALAFTVDTVAPTPSVSNMAPTTGTVMSGRVAAGGATVQVFDNGKAIGSATADASGAWSLKLTVSGNGVHSYTETATDAAGNAASSAGVTLYSSKTGQALTGGAGADVLIGRGGDTLTGGAGADHFVFNTSFGKQAINDFTPGADQMWIAKSYIPDYAHLMAIARQVGTDVVITVDRNDALTLHQVTLAGLHDTDFLFF